MSFPYQATQLWEKGQLFGPVYIWTDRGQSMGVELVMPGIMHGYRGMRKLVVTFINKLIYELFHHSTCFWFNSSLDFLQN